jgi:DNA-directed RNA polymerase I subunit RPA49
MTSERAEKKRKRDSDRHERPSKKPALEPQNMPPLAASVVEDDSELAPVLGTFLPFIFLRIRFVKQCL